MRERPNELCRTDDSGIGLVEVIVAMALLGILFAAMAPILVTSYVTTARMTTLAYANQFASDGLTDARTALGTLAACQSALSDFQPAALAHSTDRRGIDMQRRVSVTGSCEVQKVLSVAVSVTAESTSKDYHAGQVITSASTLVYVGQ